MTRTPEQRAIIDLLIRVQRLEAQAQMLTKLAATRPTKTAAQEAAQ